MYKFTNNLSTAKLILVRKRVGEGPCSLIVMRGPQRQLNTKPCPPQISPHPPKSRKLLYSALGAALIGGAAVVYCKNSPDTRNWVATNAPLANDIIALIFQENTTYWDVATNKMKKATDIVRDFMFGKEGQSPMDFPMQYEQDLEKDAAIAFAPKTYELPPATFGPLYKEELVLETPDVDAPVNLVQTDKCPPLEPVVIDITKDIVDLENEMLENVKTAIDHYKNATKNCENYNKELYRIVEATHYDLDKNMFTALQVAMTEREAAAAVAAESAGKARAAMATLARMIKDKDVKAPPENLVTSSRHIKNFTIDLNKAEADFHAEQERSVLSDRYMNRVMEARNAYKRELETMFPGVDLSARKLELKGDTDLLLLHTLRKVQFLQKELAEIQTTRDLKIQRAIECGDEAAIINAKAEEMVKRELVEKEKEREFETLKVQAEANRKLKNELKRQYEIHQEVLQDKLNRKEKEVLGKFSRLASEEVEKERVVFKKDMAAMAGRMKAIEETLRRRARAEAEARRSQSLWAAAEALLAATKRNAPQVKIDKEIKAVEKAGKDDKLVTSVLKGIPKEAREEGIVTEQALKERFETIDDTARKVALVGRDGAGLPTYFLSWLQSKLLFKGYSEIPRDELENKPTDFTKLDTFDIMHRARHHMCAGELGAALRYVNLLQGAPRAAAQAWADAARRHLEVRQAAEAVMAHASVAGLLYS